MREEILDACFGDRTFVLEASLYRDTAGGLLVLPPRLLPTAWVKRLLIITVLEIGGTCQGVADLRPLQQMTSLEHVRIVATLRDRCKNVPFLVGGQPVRTRVIVSPIADKRPDNPITAVVECVPKSAKVEVDVSGETKDELLRTFGEGVRYLCYQPASEADMDATVTDLTMFQEKQGRLSGSKVDHSQCLFADCKEELECVNSRCDRWYDAPEEGASAHEVETTSASASVVLSGVEIVFEQANALYRSCGRLGRIFAGYW